MFFTVGIIFLLFISWEIYFAFPHVLTCLPSEFLSLFGIHVLFLRRHCLCRVFPFNLQCAEVIACLHLLTSYHFLMVSISTLHFVHFLSAGLHAISGCWWFHVQSCSFSLSHYSFLLPELRSVDHFRTRSGRLIISLYNSLCPFDRFKQYLFSHYFHCWSNPLSWNLQKTHTKFISTCTFFRKPNTFWVEFLWFLSHTLLLHLCSFCKLPCFSNSRLHGEQHSLSVSIHKSRPWHGALRLQKSHSNAIC